MTTSDWSSLALSFTPTPSKLMLREDFVPMESVRALWPVNTARDTINTQRSEDWGRSELSQSQSPASITRTDTKRPTFDRSELQTLRRSRRYATDGPAAAAAGELIIPSQSHGTCCPTEECIGVPTRRLPCCKFRALQMCFGNLADASKTDTSAAKVEHEANTQYLDTKTSLELKHHGESGWREHVTASSVAKEHESTRERALKLLGIRQVIHESQGETQQGLMLRFLKKEAPGTLAQVKDLISKLLKLRHPGVVSLIDATEDDHCVYLVYEDVFRPADIVREVEEKGAITHSDCAMLLQQLGSALTRMASTRLYMLDWSPWNLFSSTPTGVCPVKLFGVGLAGIMYAEHLPDGAGFEDRARQAFRFQSPEVYKAYYAVRSGTGASTDKGPGHRVSFYGLVAEGEERAAADGWSLAAIAYYSLSGHSPAFGTSPDSARGEIMNGIGFRDPAMEFIRGDNNEGLEFLQAALHCDWQKRMKLKDVLRVAWITTQVHNGPRLDINDIIDSLVDFAEFPDVIKGFSSLAQNAAHPDKMRLLEDCIQQIDDNGSGTITCRNLCDMCIQRRKQIVSLFRRLHASNDELTTEDFTSSGVMSGKVMSERMLVEMFNSTCSEHGQEQKSTTLRNVFETLRSVNENVDPRETEMFFCRSALCKDWDGPMSYDEFKKNFHNCVNSRHDAENRIHACQEKWTLLHGLFDKLRHHVESWVNDVEKVPNSMSHLGKAIKLCDSEAIEEALTRCLEGLKILGKLMEKERVPRLLLTEERVKQLGIKAGDYTIMFLQDGVPTQKRIKGAKRVCIPNKEHTAEGVAIHPAFLLDDFIQDRHSGWEASVKEATKQAHFVHDHEVGHTRVVKTTLIYTSLMDLCTGVITFTRQALDEQVAAFEAAGSMEEGMADRPWSRVGLKSGRPGLESHQRFLSEYLANRANHHHMGGAEDATKRQQRSTRTTIPQQIPTPATMFKTFVPDCKAKLMEASAAALKVVASKAVFS